MVRRAQRGENTGEELQTHLDLSAVAVPAEKRSEEDEEAVEAEKEERS